MGVLTPPLDMLGYVTAAILIIAALAIIGLMVVAIKLGNRERKENEEFDFRTEYDGVDGFKLKRESVGVVAAAEKVESDAPVQADTKIEKESPSIISQPVEEAFKSANPAPVKEEPKAEPIKSEPVIGELKAEPVKEVPKAESKPEPPKAEPVKAAEAKPEPVKEEIKAAEKAEPEKTDKPASQAVKPIAPAAESVKQEPKTGAPQTDNKDVKADNAEKVAAAPVRPASARPTAPPKPAAPAKPPVKTAPAKSALKEDNKETPAKKAGEGAEVKKQPVKPDAAAKKTVKKKPDNWSNYDGAYDGYYYDPEDACYYSGEAPTEELKQKNAAKEAEMLEASKKPGAKKIIKKIAPPSAALNTPKHPRKTPVAAEGFDESVIYGKYVIESENGEYYFTLYSNKGDNLFESKNYSSEEFARKAIDRFKSQVLLGTFVVKGGKNKFRFVLTRKGSVNEGNEVASILDANNNIRDVKYYASTDIIRVQ